MKFSFAQVEGLFKQVKPFLDRAGVKKATMPEGDIHRIDAQKFIDAFDYLYDLMKTDEWEAVQSIWRRLPAETWEMYDALELEGHREQTLLTQALKGLANEWKNRPKGFFGRKIDPPSADDLGFQPEGTESAESDS